MNFSIGSLVKARGREWIVLPDSQEDMLVLRPLGGSDLEITGLHLGLEQVEPAEFAPPDPSKAGAAYSAQLLRDAARLGFRATAGPFRSFGRLAFEPRPYQLVPLMMALRQDPVRLLIADDVGIGKTIEAALIVRELLDRGEITRFVVLCPPSLAEQWKAELEEKFNLEAKLVLPSTVSRLERGLGLSESLFERHPYTIVSTEYIKSNRRRDEFLRSCPEFVIVDEAHTCAFNEQTRGGRKQRYELMKGVAENKNRHIVLVTATPHSGKEEAFRSLLEILNPAFSDLPEDLTGKENEPLRRELARYFVQRRRGDITHYLKADTPFPEREELEEHYYLTPEYRKLFDNVLRYARELVLDKGQQQFHQRVRWWSALALLRSLASSPAAAEATLRTRAAAAQIPDEDTAEADRIGERTVMDLMLDEAAGDTDIIPGADFSDPDSDDKRHNRRLMAFARDAKVLYGDLDAKLLGLIDHIKPLLKEGHNPIVFCRFIPTAEYVASELRERMARIKGLKNVDVIAVTGLLAPEEREARIQALDRENLRVLVATDCLSEGINLQDYFDAVIHYDLSWNPTRHEQREGRVDRFGQRKKTVSVITYFGIDNRIDGIVLEVLLRKHKQIRDSLGISVPVPANSNQVVEAIFEGLLMRFGEVQTGEMILPGFEEFLRPTTEDIFKRWDKSEDREKRSRTMFAQERLKPEVVAEALAAAGRAAGSAIDVDRFTTRALNVGGCHLKEIDGGYHIDPDEARRPLRDLIQKSGSERITFQHEHRDGKFLLTRTHPFVEGLAAFVLDSSLDPLADPIAARCGIIRTSLVKTKTTLCLLRVRYHLSRHAEDGERTLLVEDLLLPAYSGSGAERQWLVGEQQEMLLGAEPEANISHAMAMEFLQHELEDRDELLSQLTILSHQHADRILADHINVRKALQIRGRRPRIRPYDPPDLLGLYIYLPVINRISGEVR